MAKLNTNNINKAMNSSGMNAAKLANTLGVSREAVSKWLNNKSFPRPDKLLKLSLSLSLRYEDLIIQKNKNDPRVAFRKKGNVKITKLHIKNAKEIGYLLKPLVKYLPFNKFESPSILKKPVNEYSYLSEYASQIRIEAGLDNSSVLDYKHLIKFFNDRQTVLIPVLWGKKDTHENAIHIYLPDSETTWVYLNLDVEVHDLKFWMAHELGHVLTPDLLGNEAEDFADNFASSVLFPHNLSKNAYKKVIASSNIGAQINLIKKIAEHHTISPITVFKQINNYAEYKQLKPLNIPSIYGAARNLSKNYYSVSEALFNNKKPSPKEYIKLASDSFNSPFFSVLKKYIADEKAGPGYIQSVLKTTFLDAKELHNYLT